MAAWTKGISSSYSSAWGKWNSWCSERKINPALASIESVLELLTEEFNAGKAYRTFNAYRSAIYSTHSRIDSLQVGEHPLVVQLLKGAYNLRSPLLRYSSNWDVATVISFVHHLGPNKDLSLDDLSQKLGLLHALTAMEIVSEVVPITKKSRVGHVLKSSFHASFLNNSRLCVVECLKSMKNALLHFGLQNHSSLTNYFYRT